MNASCRESCGPLTTVVVQLFFRIGSVPLKETTRLFGHFKPKSRPVSLRGPGYTMERRISSLRLILNLSLVRRRQVFELDTILCLLAHLSSFFQVYCARRPSLPRTAWPWTATARPRVQCSPYSCERHKSRVRWLFLPPGGLIDAHPISRVLQRHVAGEQTQDNAISTTLIVCATSLTCCALIHSDHT